ncbi:hypothetical protein DL96DRAFT_1577993 [Flagelloscypha sp. PMI_526]|nr:hypothetical protein DL96DRAFT_1577993 [Flagelloscypha sp. PMI_526]
MGRGNTSDNIHESKAQSIDHRSIATARIGNLDCSLGVFIERPVRLRFYWSVHSVLNDNLDVALGNSQRVNPKWSSSQSYSFMLLSLDQLGHSQARIDREIDNTRRSIGPSNVRMVAADVRGAVIWKPERASSYSSGILERRQVRVGPKREVFKRDRKRI